MVYCGKPSAGCLNCRKRKIKCDESLPACSQCVKTRRVCPGYIQHFDLVLRDQTQSVRFNADRKRAGKKSPVRLNASDPAKCSKSLVKPLEPQTSCTSLIPRPCSDSSSPEPLQIVCRESSLDNASDVDSIPRALCEDPIQQAVNAFFGEFMMFNRHPDSQRGIVELLYPLYKSCHHDSLISLATSSVALAAVGGAHRRSTYYTLGYAIFGKALQMTKTAIDDPVESLSDETLITVLLLGVFERITQIAESSKRTCLHNNGAFALVKHRGKKENGKSELARSLLLTVHRQLVDCTIQGFTSNGSTSAEWAELFPYLPQNAASRLSSISAKFADLQVVARAVLDAPSRTVTEQCVSQVLKSALEIDAVLTQWPESVPSGWEWLPAFDFDCPAETPRTCFVYQDRVDIYYDLWVAEMWNNYRITRIMVQFFVLDCISRITWADSPQLMQQSRNAMRISQQMVDELCGSVPFHLGTKIGGGLGDDAGVEYPVNATSVITKNQWRASAALGGWQLIEPLRTALKVTCLREGQREWLTQQLIRIGNIYSVDLLSQTECSTKCA